MKNDNILFIGLDTHKEQTQVAYTLDHRTAEVNDLGRIQTTKTGFVKLARQLQSKYPHATLHFVYEAGPCGYWIYRLLTSLSHCCFLVAPSLIPKKPGDRVKTDKRDAQNLARLLKNNDLNPIYVPEPEDEAVRDLSRAREVGMRDLNDSKHQLKSMFLRNNIRYNGSDSWSLKHLRWLTEIVLPHPCQQIVLQEMIQTISERMARLKRLDNELTHQVKQWRYYPVVKAIQALRGVRLLIATGLITELGDLSRFDTPRKLMKYVGLTPSEHSSGDKRKLGGITKCGNGHVRRVLTESAWSYRFPARKTAHLQRSAKHTSESVQAIAWKAQKRLCGRYQHLMTRGLLKVKVCTAIARELAGFIWAIACDVMGKKSQPAMQ